MISFNFTYSGKPMIESLKDSFDEWKSQIELNQEKYQIEIIPGNYDERVYGKIVVKYASQTLFYVLFYRKYYASSDGKRTICAMYSIRLLDEGKDLLDSNDALTLYVDDKLNVNYGNNNNISIVTALMDVLPIREEDKVKRIVELLNVDSKDIIFDTYEKRYVINSPIDEFKWVQDDVPNVFYKYISLEIFHLMMENGTFRMNSIISQSDTTESFYLGDFLCYDYEDEFKRFKNILAEKNILISSFTKLVDNPKMWHDYGDRGKGICLGFKFINGGNLHQVQYIDEGKIALNGYREKTEQLKRDGIQIHYSCIDDYHRFVKNVKYEDEREWRLIIQHNGSLESSLYGDRYVKFKDFSFEKNELPLLGIKLTSIDTGPCQPNGTTNFPLIAEKAKKVFGDVLINRSRLQSSDIENLE